MTAIKQWYARNQDSITWFLIGWLSLSCLNRLAEGSYIWAMVDAVLVYINYKLSGIRVT